jgi:hypothetical protein
LNILAFDFDRLVSDNLYFGEIVCGAAILTALADHLQEHIEDDGQALFEDETFFYYLL